MPEQGNRQTAAPDTAGGPGQQHPVLEDVAEAGGMVSDAAGYLSPTRDFDVPHLEAQDWPPDLNPAETLVMLRQLAAITHDVSGCLIGITSQHAVPDAAKPELGRIADLLTQAGGALTGLAGAPGPARRATSSAAAAPSPDATSQAFPQPPVARTPGGTRPPARAATPPSARPRMTP